MSTLLVPVESYWGSRCEEGSRNARESLGVDNPPGKDKGGKKQDRVGRASDPNKDRRKSQHPPCGGPEQRRSTSGVLGSAEVSHPQCLAGASQEARGFDFKAEVGPRGAAAGGCLPTTLLTAER